MNRVKLTALALTATFVATSGQPASAQSPSRPWLNPALSPDERAALAVAQMTRDEKLRLVFEFQHGNFVALAALFYKTR